MNKTVIGAFLVGAVGLAAAGLIILGGRKFSTKRATFVMYFEGSVKGLSVGAPVVFRGVEVGQVKDIIWAEYLERYPEALIRGKGGPTRR